MKRNLFILSALFSCGLAFSQIGINTKDPKATLDIQAKASSGTLPEGLLIPRVDRERARSMSGVVASTMIYIDNAATGPQTGTVIDIDNTGYYYYDGSKWVKMGQGTAAVASDNNIYSNDGTLQGNRIVTQGNKTLAFNGTSANAFSIDDSTFSVDAANDRVGIGTSTPAHRFHVVSTVQSANRFNLIDAPASNGGGVIMALRNTSAMAAGNTSLIGFTNSGTASGGANWGIGSIRTGGTAFNGTQEEFYIGHSTGGSYVERLRISAVGNIGVGTSAPDAKLHINGSVKIADGTQGANKVLTSDDSGLARWQTPAAGISTNIYTSDGNLETNRIVAQADKTLAFTGTAANALSVDGETFSVNAANHRVGIGTKIPSTKLDVDGDLRVRNINSNTGSGIDKLVVADADGVLKTVSSSAYTLFYARLSTIQYADQGSETTPRILKLDAPVSTSSLYSFNPVNSVLTFTAPGNYLVNMQVSFANPKSYSSAGGVTTQIPNGRFLIGIRTFPDNGAYIARASKFFYRSIVESAINTTIGDVMQFNTVINVPYSGYMIRFSGGIAGVGNSCTILATESGTSGSGSVSNVAVQKI